MTLNKARTSLPQFHYEVQPFLLVLASDGDRPGRTRLGSRFASFS